MNAATPTHPPTANARHAILANAVAVGWIVGCMVVLALGDAVNGARFSPLGGRDLAVVCLLGAIPFGLSLVCLAARSLDVVAFFACCACCCAMSLVALILISARVPGITAGTGGLAGYFVRPLWALVLVSPSCWLWTLAHLPAAVSPVRLLPWLLITLSLVLMLPATFVVARCREDVTRCQELLRQSRVGEASVVLHRLRWLAPEIEVQGQPVTRVTANVDRTVRQLREAVALMPSAGAPSERWLQRATQLAMLGETDDALRSIAIMRKAGPDAKVVSGTIRETREEWDLAWRDYTTARNQWEATADSDARTAGRIQAQTGIAYCLRKQGRYREAEQAYQQLLELAPTADVHFLLAQFYEDTQQTRLARNHVHQAMQLAPDRYQQPGQQLLNKLATMHFGCFTLGSE